MRTDMKNLIFAFRNSASTLRKCCNVAEGQLVVAVGKCCNVAEGQLVVAVGKCCNRTLGSDRVYCR